MDENLSLKLWSTLRCHGTESHLIFLKKFVQRPNDYLLVITNAEAIFIEVLTFEEIKVRCRNLNNRLEAPVKSIISHIEQSLNDDLNQNFSFTPVTGGMHLNLNNLFHEMPFTWVFKCVRDQSGLIRSTLIEPLVITVARLVLENEALKNLLHEKDAELEEYAENEGVQSKFTMKTDKFCKEKFGLKICQMKDYVTVLSENALTAVAGSAFNNQLIMSSEHRKSNDVSTRCESPSKGNIAVVAAVDKSPVKVINNKRRIEKSTEKSGHINYDSDNELQPSSSKIPNISKLSQKEASVNICNEKTHRSLLSKKKPKTINKTLF